MKSLESYELCNLIKKSLNSIPYSFILISVQNYKVVAVNKQMSSSLGKTEEELIGKNVLDIFPPKTAKIRKKYAELVIKTKKPQFFEDERDGRWFLNQFYPLLNRKDEVTHGIVFVEEITNRKKDEKKFVESEEKFRILSDQSLMGLGIIQEGQIKYANNAIIDITGYSKKDMFNEGVKILSKIVHPDDLSFVSEQLRKKLAGDEDAITRYSCKIITKNGEIKWVEIFSKTIKFEGKNADFITFVDITDAKRTEKILREKEAKWRSLVDNAPDIITQIDSKGIIRYVNHLPKDEKYKKFNPIGKKVIDLVPEKYRNQIENTYNRVLKTGVSESFEVQGSISSRWFNTHVGAIFDNETPIGLTTITRDITKQKKADSDIRRGKDYLQKIIDNTSEIIFTIGKDTEIKTWNKTAEKITGIKRRQVVGKSIKQLEFFDNLTEIIDYIKNIKNKKTVIIKEISINTIYGIKNTFSVSPSYIKDELNNVIEILFVCRDITQEKEKYGVIKSGNSYLIQESYNTTGINIFNSLLESRKLGLFIGRIPNKELQFYFKNNNPTIIKLTSQKDDQYTTSNNIEELYQKIKTFITNKKNTVILFDRFDYLIINNSFEPLMKTLYKINDLIQKRDSILLIRVNPSIINQNQIAILKEEFKIVPSQKITDLQINQELHDILIYIQSESKNNITVTYGIIGKAFSISKVTVKKRLESLIDNGLIYSRKKGKTKILNITEKGKNLLKNKKNI